MKTKSIYRPCTWKQAQALAMIFTNSDDERDWVQFKRIRACLYAEGSNGNLSSEEAKKLFELEDLPENYHSKIEGYVQKYKNNRSKKNTTKIKLGKDNKKSKINHNEHSSLLDMMKEDLSGVE